MKPVMMQALASDTEAYRACLATALEMDLEDFPEFEGLAATMQWDAWFATELNLCALRFEVGAVATPPGIWLARLESPYPGYDVHTILCAGPRPIHDPHPEPQEYAVNSLLSVVELLLPMDPGLPSGRYMVAYRGDA